MRLSFQPDPQLSGFSAFEGYARCAKRPGAKVKSCATKFFKQPRKRRQRRK